MKELLGVKQGCRLFARLQARQGAGRRAAAGGGSSDDSRSPPSPRRSLPGGRHAPPASRVSRYGSCCVPDCPHASSAVCSVAECAQPLCVWHAEKSLLTGHTYCAGCEQATLEGRLRAALRSAMDTADEATNSIIATTADWTARVRDGDGDGGRGSQSQSQSQSRPQHQALSSIAVTQHYQQQDDPLQQQEQRDAELPRDCVLQ